MSKLYERAKVKLENAKNSYKKIQLNDAYMDDCCFMGRTKTGIKNGIKAFAKWMRENMSISIRMTTGIISLLTVKEEKERKRMEKPSQRGCPCLDMGVYRIYRTHVTIRHRCVKRLLRNLLRAGEEIARTGTIQRDRAQSLVSRLGFIKNSDSMKLMEKYNVSRIIAMAKRICSFWGRVRSRQRKVFLNKWLESDSLLRKYSYG